MFEEYLSEAIRVRRELHKIPETSYEEFETHRYICDYLNALGYQPETCNKTGVICFIDMGAKEAVGLRSDMDALTVTEENDCDFVSLHPGKMHACGHDGHMTMLLLLAKAIAEKKLTFTRNILLIFQPAEENIGGADAMIKSGILDRYNVSKVYAFHLSSDYPKGKIASREGEFFAASAEYYVDITGKSAHGAQPELGKDAMYAAVLFIENLKKIIPEGSDKFKTGIISAGTLNAGSAINIIAGKAKITGITRAFEADIYERNIELIQKAGQDAAKQSGCEVEVKVNRTYPAVVNDHEQTKAVREILKDRFIDAERTFLAEDFAFFCKARPSVFMLLGIRDETHDKPLHNCRFNFDESVLLRGVEAYVGVLEG